MALFMFTLRKSSCTIAHQGRLLLLELEELEAGWVCAPSSGLQLGAAGAPSVSHPRPCPLRLRSPTPALQKGELQHQNQRTDAGSPLPRCLCAVHGFPGRPLSSVTVGDATCTDCKYMSLRISTFLLFLSEFRPCPALIHVSSLYTHTW